MMRVELVCPAAEDSAFLRSASMAVLTGLTPPDVELRLRDDIVHRIDPARDLGFDAQLAAITVSTKAALRAYQLADAYRAAGVKVVLGGIHPTVMPEEALGHADAVVQGEAEGLWQQVLRDAQQGTLQPIYRHRERPDFSRPPRADWRLFRSRRYIPIYTLQASRGCPHGCDFCSVTPLFGRRMRLRQVDHLAAEIEGLDRRWVMFADDNIVGSPRHARQLFRALRPLGLTWYGQASLSGLRDPQLVREMAASGCKALFIGFESVNPRSLQSCGKQQNHPERYLETVRMLHDHGIGVWASFVLGLDDDGPDVFERTLELAIRARFFMATFAIQTPYPGTALYQRLLAEGRLLNPSWWLDPERALDVPLFVPRQMSPEQLHAGWQWTWQQFYSAGSMARRLRQGSLHTLAAFLPINLLQRALVSRKIVGGERFFRRDTSGPDLHGLAGRLRGLLHRTP